MESRCTHRQAPSLEWVDYTDPNHDDAHGVEDFLATVAPATAMHYRSQLSVKERLAAQGRLEDGAYGVEPIASFRELFEMHWFFRAANLRSTVHVRQYHGEPQSSPHLLIRLLRHIKHVGVVDIKALQNQALSRAKLRYEGGRQTSWGTE